MSEIKRVYSDADMTRHILAGPDMASLPDDYPTSAMARDRMADIERLGGEIARLRSAIIKICDRAHKPMVGCAALGEGET